MAGKTRNSSIELLRIICIFGIIFMHTVAYGGDELADYNRYIQIVINCFTNLGVTCFMLISGYFGVKFNLEKLIKLDLMIIFYSLITLVIRGAAVGETVGGMDMLSAVFPVLSNQYWYITAYFIIVILSPYINLIPEKLEKKQFERILLVLIFLFAVVPVFLHFDILGSEGKNVVYMTLIYLIGRYLQKYQLPKYRTSRVLSLLVCNIVLTQILEVALFTVTRRYSFFYRDSSIFTLVSATLLFLIFRNISFESKVVNRMASCVLAVYVFSFGFQRLVHLVLPLEDYAFSPSLFPLICIFAMSVVAGCIIIDLLRQILLGGIETKLASMLSDGLHKILTRGRGIGLQFTDKIKTYIMDK